MIPPDLREDLMNRFVRSALFPSFSCLVLALAVPVSGCGEGGIRAAFGDEEQTSDPTEGDEGNGGPGGSFGGTATGDVELDPKNTTIIIDTATNPITPGAVTYKVKSKGQEATADTTFAVDNGALGKFNGATFTSADKLPNGALGVSTTVQATTKDGVGLGRLTIVSLRKTGDQRDFFFIVPYGGDPSPKNDTLKFSTNIKKVDVAFNMDTTGSMTGSINNLKTALSGSLLSQLQAAIPDVGLAIVDFRDYPSSSIFGGYGSPGDWPVKVHQKITTNLSAAQTAVGKYVAGGGGDGPEAAIPAMQHILTGEALSWSGGSVAQVTPSSPGAWGGVEFRPGAVPVVVNITDIDWHGENHTPYNFTTPTMATLKPAFQSKNAFFVDVSSGDQSQANELSDATNSNVDAGAFGGTCGTGKCCTGVNGGAVSPNGPGGKCRLVFQHSGGSGVSTGIVKAIEAISVGAAYDVKATASNDPKNPKGVDATKFIKALRAMDEGNAAAGCPVAAAKDSDGDGIKDTFVAVKVGTPVCFEVIPAKNDTVMPENEAQFFNAFVDVVGVQGNVQLDKRTVLFLVPPKDPGVN
jgi:hypothetical protein